MRPLKIRLLDFMSYQNAEIDLTNIDLAVITGPNGAGKSTLLQAITYALWGQVKPSSHNDVVRRGTGGCTVTLDFAIGCEVYRVTRRRDLSGRGSSDLEFSYRDNKGNTPLTGPTIKDTQAEIDRTLGLSYDVFANSAFLQQGDADRFSRARPGERKELLGAMMGLGAFQGLEKRARARSKEIGNEIFTTEAIVNDAEEELEDIGEIDIHHATLDRMEAANNYAELKDELEKLRDTLDTLKGIRARITTEEKTLDDAHLRSVAYEEKLASLQVRIAILKDTVDQKEMIEANKKEHDELKMELAALDADMKVWLKIKELKAQIELAAESYRAEARKIPELELRVEEYKNQRNALNNEYMVLEEQLKTATLRADEAATGADEAGERLNSAREDFTLANSRYEDQLKKVELLEGQSICPTCGQEIEDPEQMVRSEKIILIELLEALELADVRVKDLQTQLETSRAIKTSTESTLRAWDEKHSAKEYEIGTVHTAKAIVEKNLVAAYEAKWILDNKDFCVEHREELARLGDVFYDQEAHDKTRDRFRELDWADTAYANLLNAEAELEEKRAEVVSYKLMIEKEKKIVDGASVEIETLWAEMDNIFPSEINNVDACEWEIKKAGVAIDMAEEDLKEKDYALTVLQQQAERKKALQRKIKEGKSRIGLLEQELEIADLLVKATSKEGAQALIIESVLPQLEKDANEYLEVMSDGIEVALESQRTTLKGDASETLDIRVLAGGLDAPIETLSGGERFRADLALRLAISKMLSRRSGTRIEVLAIDEGWGSQDGEGQEAVVEIIGSLTGLFPLIMTITHIESVAAALGVVGTPIMVSKVGNKSKVEVKDG